MTLSSQITPAILERYEKKYLIPYSYIEPISQFASIYCSLDKYSELSEDRFYQVNNLYFDSPNYTFLKNRLDGVENRFNMRIRSYGENPDPPYFCEIKQKHKEYVRKYRGQLKDDNWRHLFEPNETDLVVTLNNKDKNIQLFQRMLHSYNATPKVFTNYRRKAYISNHEEYSRLTFDINLRYMEQQNYSLKPIEENLSNYDHEINFESGANVILELKCYTTHVPLWMIDLVREFNLIQRGFSKYATGVIEVLELYVNKNPERISVY